MKSFIILALLCVCVFAGKKLQATEEASEVYESYDPYESTDAYESSEAYESNEAYESSEYDPYASAADESETASPMVPSGPSIVSVVMESKVHTVLSSLLQSLPDVTELLMQEGPYTLFAPTDEAFNRVPAETLAALQADTDMLKAVLAYHVLPGLYRTNDFDKCQSLPTLYESEAVLIRRDSAGVSLNDMARVGEMDDKKAPNGIVHGIDSVLMPMSMWDCSSMTGTQCLLTNGCRLRMNGKCRNTKHVCSRREISKSISQSIEASMEASEKASKSMSKSLSRSAAANPSESVSPMDYEEYPEEVESTENYEEYEETAAENTDYEDYYEPSASA